jgi:hypothetical protein
MESIFTFPSEDDKDVMRFGPDRINLCGEEPGEAFDFEAASEEDAELGSVLLQLQRHAQGIRDNHRQSDGISDAIVRASMALG